MLRRIPRSKKEAEGMKSRIIALEDVDGLRFAYMDRHGSLRTLS